MNKNILNDYLPWDGSHLGAYNNNIVEQWVIDGVMYYEILLPKGWNLQNPQIIKTPQIPEGIIYCTGVSLSLIHI